MSWKVTSAVDDDLTVELRDDGTLFWTEAVTDYFHDTLVGKTIFDSVSQAPLFVHFSTGDDDATAAFLNASLYLPKAEVDGEPPVDLFGDDYIVPPDPMDAMDWGEKAMPDDSDIPSEIRMLLLAMTDEDILADAETALAENKDTLPSANPGATRLRVYWTRGEGAAKIRWGVPHDFYRCVDHLTKYVGTRAKGLCAIYHRAAIGVWPGREKGFDWAQEQYFIALKDLVLDNGEIPSEGEAQ